MLVSCKKEEEPESPYYFRFRINGVQYDYKYECEKGLFGGSCSMGAMIANKNSVISNFQMYGYNPNESVKYGRVQFDIHKDDFWDKDTIYIDGSRNIITVRKIFTQLDFYNPISPTYSRVIFTKREENMLTGTFEFDAVLRDGEDTIHVTDGEFCVGFAN